MDKQRPEIPFAGGRIPLVGGKSRLLSGRRRVSGREIRRFGTISRKNCEFLTVAILQPDILRLPFASPVRPGWPRSTSGSIRELALGTSTRG